MGLWLFRDSNVGKRNSATIENAVEPVKDE